jgi:heparan-alpha-glucosaminide N-acetyltransferase
LSEEPETLPSKAPGRLASLDVYRGFVLLLMLGELLATCAVAAQKPASEIWVFVCRMQSHVEWVGCSLHDLIQPSFTFLVGAALPFSLASRAALQHSWGRLTRHAFKRAAILVGIGVLLRMIDHPRGGVTFEDTLTQIGLGYGFLFMLAFRPRRDQWAALAVILVGYWAAFAAYPLPGPDFSPPSVGVPVDWPHWLSGFPAHWNKNTNPAWRFDVFLLNWLPNPRRRPFEFNWGGYATLSFIPTLGTMILGLLAGEVLRRESSPRARLSWLVGSGCALLAAGWLLGALGICPVVKRIWTPSFVLYSGGICLLFLAAFHHWVDQLGYVRWSLPLIVLGTNSLATYCLYELLGSPFDRLRNLADRLLGLPLLETAYVRMFEGALFLGLLWLVLFWMYRRRVFWKV